MNTRFRLLSIVTLLILAAASFVAAATQNPPMNCALRCKTDCWLNCPLLQSGEQTRAEKISFQSKETQAEHSGGVNRRGDQMMGFDHMKTTHHFWLNSGGGIIEVQANNPADTASRDQIRQHLAHIAQMFSEGDFHAPIFIHDQVPPGVEVMKELNAAVHYRFEAMPLGGRVIISTADSKALSAVHDFLRFQIKDHQTGDPLEVRDKS